MAWKVSGIDAQISEYGRKCRTITRALPTASAKHVLWSLTSSFCDYDHEQRFRGYLCRRCKLVLSYANDDSDTLRRLHDLLVEEQES
jgi:hypothetical protein